jgi:aromatic ring hydroxylase
MTGEGSGSSASGLVEDVTSHAATRAVVDEYVAWYDRHLDPDWRDILLTPPDATGERSPWGYVVPKSAADLSRMGRCFSKTTFLSAGNLTPTPAYGQLIALGVLCATQEATVSPKQIGDAAAYRDLIAATGRFLTFSAGAATIGYRMREDPGERAAIKVVRETDAGLVLAGKIGMHTGPAYAEDVYVGAFSGVDIDGHRATYIVPGRCPGRDGDLPKKTPPEGRTRSRHRSAAATTNSTGRCGSKTCSSPGSASSCWINHPSR